MTTRIHNYSGKPYVLDIINTDGQPDSITCMPYSSQELPVGSKLNSTLPVGLHAELDLGPETVTAPDAVVESVTTVAETAATQAPQAATSTNNRDKQHKGQSR